MWSLLGVKKSASFAALLGLAPLLSMSCAVSVAAATPSETFEEAVRFDLQGKTQLAFATYLRAAQTGLSQAQFDVAVMLDSGRGTPRNMPEAALWYARAAAHGNQRAAYNLGQLYESGEGVPQNVQLSRAWFAASSLPASSTHIKNSSTITLGDTVTLSAPEMISPYSNFEVVPEAGGIVLVWTSQPEPVPVDFYVELRFLDGLGSREIYASSVKTSSVYVGLSNIIGKYAWRVSAFSISNRKYAQSKWFRFTLIVGS